MQIDWDESRLAALNMSSVLLQNIQQTQGRSLTVGNLSLTIPTTRAEDLDRIHHDVSQKILDFLTTDQFDGDLSLRMVALQTAINHRTAVNLTDMLVNHSFVSDFRTQQQSAYRQIITDKKKELELLKQKNASKPNNHLKDSIRVLTLSLTRVHKTNTATIPYAIVTQVWDDLLKDTIAAAEKSANIGAMYIRSSDEPIKKTISISGEDILQHREKQLSSVSIRLSTP